MKEHCGKTEPCADDVYCNCYCELCKATECFRPSCECSKSHYARNRSDIDEWEILSQKDLSEKRLTKFNCSVCLKPLSEVELSDIRKAHAPCKHYHCFMNGT